jgi:RNA polymerase sigma factor (sigma-70 family)
MVNRTHMLLPERTQKVLAYHFCRLRLPDLAISYAVFERHLQRSFDLCMGKAAKNGSEPTWSGFFNNLHATDWYLACACLERQPRAWDQLFALRASRADCLLVDALRARAVRLFPRNEERQESAVTDFWGYLIAGERPGSLPILARFDGQRPLVPWLIRVFQNKHISELRNTKGVHSLPDEELGDVDLPFPMNGDARWHDEFREAAREWLQGVADNALLLLGLLLRYRLSQRQVAQLLGIHEGNISRQTAKVRNQCLEEIGKRMLDAGWEGDDLSGFVLKEMDSVLMDEPRLSAQHLASLLSARGKNLDSVLAVEASS